MIVASLKKKTLGRLLRFPLELMDEFEVELVSWIAEYNQKYSAIPSLDRLLEHFDDFIPIDLGEDYVLDDIADTELKRKQLSYFVSKMTSVIEETRATEEVQLAGVFEVMKSIVLANGDDVAFTTYDRSKYHARATTRAVPFFAGILNNAMGNLHAGDYTLIVARLGTGKSLITQWQAVKWMLSGLKVLFVSQEMLANEIFARMDGMVASFNPLELRKSEMEDAVGAKLKVAQITATANGGEIYAPKGLKTPEQIAMAAKFFGVDTVIVDGVYQLAPDLKVAPSARWERLTEVSGQLKQMAQTIGLPMLATTQLKRTGKSGAFDPEDIAFADALGQDADQIIALSHDDVYPNRIEASLIKNRYGPPLSALLDFTFDDMKIEEVR